MMIERWTLFGCLLAQVSDSLVCRYGSGSFFNVSQAIFLSNRQKLDCFKKQYRISPQQAAQCKISFMSVVQTKLDLCAEG